MAAEERAEPASPGQALLDDYRQRVAAGSLAGDPAQEKALGYLAELADKAAGYSPAPPRAITGWRMPFFKRGDTAQQAPASVYLYGGVGRGKSMLMDLFFEHVPVAAKRRVHFHEFMAEIHDAIHAWRDKRRKPARGSGAAAAASGDPIPPLADRVTRESWLLCFDEFQVSDIADAMILSRLFEALFERGCVMVATSNTEPDKLYWDGLQRDRVLPFIDRLKRQAHIVPVDGGEDYRLKRLRNHEVYHVPADAAGEQMLAETFEALTGKAQGQLDRLDRGGRSIPIPQAAGGVARLHFDDLCRQALGAGDYLALARRYHTVLLAGVPAMTPEMRNEALRFIHLIDALYEHGVKLICTAEAHPPGLYPEGDNAEAFQRTASRLMEMQSEAYLALPHRPEAEPARR